MKSKKNSRVAGCALARLNSMSFFFAGTKFDLGSDITYFQQIPQLLSIFLRQLVVVVEQFLCGFQTIPPTFGPWGFNSPSGHHLQRSRWTRV